MFLGYTLVSIAALARAFAHLFTSAPIQREKLTPLAGALILTQTPKRSQRNK